MTDLIDTLAGIAPGSALDKARDNRPEARKHAQASYDALFAAKNFGSFSALERFAVAAFVAGLHGRPEMEAFYGSGLAAAGASTALQAAIGAAVTAAKVEGPYGHYPKGPLSAEDKAGPVHRIAAPTRDALGRRLAAAFEHAHMLVFHPRDSAPTYLQALLDAGWSTTGIVVISQLVAFLSYQIRVVAGLRVLNARPA